VAITELTTSGNTEYDLPSLGNISNPNKTPPIGALNLAAIPEATPETTIILLCYLDKFSF
jgi:hypothetical protein